LVGEFLIFLKKIAYIERYLQKTVWPVCGWFKGRWFSVIRS